LSHNNDVDVKNYTAALHNVMDWADDVMNNTGNDNDIDHCNIVDAGDIHDGCELSDNLQTSVTRDALISDQKNDNSLQNYWSLLQRGKSNFCMQDGILMRAEKILGQNFTQLVVPKSKREQVLELGHDFAGHMSPKKCSQRIRLNFW